MQGEVLAPRGVAHGVVGQHIRRLSDLLSEIAKDGRWHLLMRIPGSTGESEIGELHRKAQAILGASMLLDDREVFG
jgi:hypothetical protein